MRQVWVTCGLGRGRRKLSFLESRGTKRHSSAAQGRNADSEATSPHVPDEQTNQPKRKVSLLETHQVPPEGPTAAPLQRPGLGGHHPASWARRHRRPAAGTTEMLRLAVRRHRPEAEAEAEARSLPGHRRTCPSPAPPPALGGTAPLWTRLRSPVAFSRCGPECVHVSRLYADASGVGLEPPSSRVTSP